MKPDDKSIEDDDLLYKYSPSIPLEGWLIWDEGDAHWKVKSGAFQWHDDGISSYLDSALTAAGLTWIDVKTAQENGVFRIGVGAVRKLGLGVARDPNPSYIAPSDLRPRDVAHALITTEPVGRSAADKIRRRLAAQSSVVFEGDRPTNAPEPAA